MRGCHCKTCEGQRAYDRSEARRARHAEREQKRRAALDEIAYARLLSANRAGDRRRAERRDQQRASQLRGAT